jgi:ribosomal protein L24E
MKCYYCHKEIKEMPIIGHYNGIRFYFCNIKCYNYFNEIIALVEGLNNLL